jgi:redox-sensitive bicupin YhaK (pirin superfamily)
MYHGRVVPGFPQHPHRGFETVTVVRQGLIDHADSLKAAGRFGDGDVQWMTAGRGIVHSEVFPLLRGDGPNPAELFQIWLNLPRARKMVTPDFKMLWRERIPTHVALDGSGRRTRVAVVAGRLGDAAPPSPPENSYGSDPAADLAIWNIAMEAGAAWTLPPAREGTGRVLYFFSGEGLHVGGRAIGRAHAVQLTGDRPAPFEARQGAIEMLLLQGRPLGEPVAVYGPFVMNSEAEIRQAFADYQRTGFGGFPWDRDDPIHGDEGRFARYPDGRVERPNA